MSERKILADRSGPRYQSRHIIDEASHVSIEIAVADGEGRPVTSHDFARKLEETDRLNEDIEPNFRAQLSGI
jgi:hypothetical protein